MNKLGDCFSLWIGGYSMAALAPFLTLLSGLFIFEKPLSESTRLFENLHLLRMLCLLSFLPSEAHSLFFFFFLVFRSLAFFLSPPGLCWGTVNWSAALSQAYIHNHTQRAHTSCGLPVIVFTRTQSNLENENCNRITLRQRIVWRALDKLKKYCISWYFSFSSNAANLRGKIATPVVKGTPE